MIRIISIQRFGLYGVVQYVEGGIIKARNIDPALNDADVMAVLNGRGRGLKDLKDGKDGKDSAEIEARLRDKGNADGAESDGGSGKTGAESEAGDGKLQEPQDGGCPGGEPGEPGTGAKIEDLSLDELKAIAKEFKIKGYGLFSREKLIAEISKGTGNGK